MYGLPKCHNNGVQSDLLFLYAIRRLMLCLAWRLEAVRQRIAKHGLQDTFQLIGSVKALRVKRRGALSLDVTQRFAKVPITDKIECLCDHTRNSGLAISLSITFLKHLLPVCIYNIQLKTNDRIYRH